MNNTECLIHAGAQMWLFSIAAVFTGMYLEALWKPIQKLFQILHPKPAPPAPEKWAIYHPTYKMYWHNEPGGWTTVKEDTMLFNTEQNAKVHIHYHGIRNGIIKQLP